MRRRCTHLVKVPTHDVDVPGECLQVVIALLGAQVPRAEDVLDLSRHQKLLELGWQGVAPVRNVQVAEHQDQLREKGMAFRGRGGGKKQNKWARNTALRDTEVETLRFF